MQNPYWECDFFRPVFLLSPPMAGAKLRLSESPKSPCPAPITAKNCCTHTLLNLSPGDPFSFVSLSTSSPLHTGERCARSVLCAELSVQTEPGGAGLHRLPGPAAHSAVIYALIRECLFLPGDCMGPRLHIIFAFAFASPFPLPPPLLTKWFSFL